jgi:hypothetical protein
MEQTISITPPLSAGQAAEFRAYWRTGPTIRDACTKYRVTRPRVKAVLAELDLEPPAPCGGRPRRASNTTLATQAAKEEERGSIADRFRTLDQVNLNPYRYPWPNSK